MDFSWTSEQLVLQKRVIEFAQNELDNKSVVKRDQNCIFPQEEWRKCGQFGLHGLAVPKEYGGSGHDLMTTLLAMEGLGYGCRDNGLTFAINAQYVSITATLLKVATEAQKQKYVRGICQGELIGAYAMTEPGSGSDAFSLQTTAKETDNGYLLNGHKSLLTFGPVADFFLVFATADPAWGQWGISLFLVERDTPGLTATANLPKMGLRTVPIGELKLEDCFVPAGNLIGEEGSGAAVFAISQDVERSAILASQLGIMSFQVERAINYAQTRKQFGQPIGNFQTVSHRIANMQLRLETARLLAYKAVWQIENGENATMSASLANIYMAESFIQSSQDAMMIHGGLGYLTATEVERDLRDAMGGPVYGGTSDIQRNIVASQLGI
ncbi:MAG: alkylation response protein AidB-like acyl-CoA dehydrogenase [Cellvibrionaceae bacterium]|jgi:alkylation response protein AidB-like acyl-CoA dehydrogenase